MRRARIVGTGAYLPARVVSNEELSRTVDTSHEWIVQRTGIEQRHIAADGEMTSDLACAAAREALQQRRAGRRSPGSDHRRDHHARPYLPRLRRRRSGQARRRSGRRLRPSGGLQRLRLRPGGRRQLRQGRAGRERAGDRRRDLLAPARLGGPADLRAVRRRRRRGRAARRGGHRHGVRSRRAGDPAGLRRAPLPATSTSTAGRRRPAPPAMSG